MERMAGGRQFVVVVAKTLFKGEVATTFYGGDGSDLIAVETVTI